MGSIRFVREPNTGIILGASELLEALNGVLQFLRAHGGGQCRDGWTADGCPLCAAVDNADAAIAKANAMSWPAVRVVIEPDAGATGGIAVPTGAAAARTAAMTSHGAGTEEVAHG